jgi:thiamine biosynthesis protein ThiS
MHIVVNGESREVDDGLTAWQLIELLGLTEGRLAMEVNRQIVPRSTFDTHRLRPGDEVEIVRAIGGGSQNAAYRQQVKKRCQRS